MRRPAAKRHLLWTALGTAALHRDQGGCTAPLTGRRCGSPLRAHPLQLGAYLLDGAHDEAFAELRRADREHPSLLPDVKISPGILGATPEQFRTHGPARTDRENHALALSSPGAVILRAVELFRAAAEHPIKSEGRRSPMLASQAFNAAYTCGRASPERGSAETQQGGRRHYRC